MLSMKYNKLQYEKKAVPADARSAIHIPFQGKKIFSPENHSSPNFLADALVHYFRAAHKCCCMKKPIYLPAFFAEVG